ncbi:acyl-CoA dehydrogenase [Actinoplanes cyaneus]|uniref:Acyl-CoA dehydrogenase n=1 Tax=Actinoplanes cyaneus TaxID=52696 RepID=A0A919IML6_9ACTN|nr:acyl-CoA dehydrogenase family protein [Actinoplanes cyaneus]MCW2138235.1 Acyl-CoA dehydrogenase [Actinoplanes cyaneus]GID66193.1 acyl-CoA dehydrogenase [Actinoplanes cyaneus]
MADRLGLLRDQVRDWAQDLRPYGDALDRDPGVVERLLHLPIMAWSARLQIPAAYNPDPLVLGGETFYLTGSAERTVFCAEVARADLGMMLALPGASMAGTLVSVIGDEAQRAWFYGRLRERPTWTFFGLTEPGGGSDAAALRTRGVTRGDEVVLTGAKRYVSNAVRAALGVVFFRSGDSPLSVGAALVEAGTPGLRVAPIETIGVRGAQLGAITLDAARIPADRVLGRHRSPVRRGMWGWLRTFNLLRPTVAGMAVGVAWAAYDYAREHRDALSHAGRESLEPTRRRIEAVHRMTVRAAESVDRDPGNGAQASAAKLTAADLAAEVTRDVLGRLGPGARVEHPRLERLARDARALDLMEGTGNVQRLSLATAYLRSLV